MKRLLYNQSEREKEHNQWPLVITEAIKGKKMMCELKHTFQASMLKIIVCNQAAKIAGKKVKCLNFTYFVDTLPPRQLVGRSVGGKLNY